VFWRRLLSLRRTTRATISHPLWRRALEYSRYAQALAPDDRVRLRDVATQFLNAKHIYGAVGFEPTAEARAVIALKAALPVLHLGLEHYNNWSGVIVYPADFRVNEEYTDEIGVVHRGISELCGQSLHQGPIVLSWESIVEERNALDRDTVVHECAHKLDVANGSANGFPSLPAHLPVEQWSRTFNADYERFCRTVESGVETELDPYAAVDPAEFFAVVTETFFTAPSILVAGFPAVYYLLTSLYRQDPFSILGDPK
jgi:MtfA peptidase